MADKVLCDKADLVTIADSVREQTETYNVPELGTAITEGLTEQADLISQIQTTLEGKAAGGGGMELPELTTPGTAADLLTGKELIDGNGEIVTGTMPNNGEINQTFTAGDQHIDLPAGYTSGGRISTSSDLVSVSNVTATAFDVKEGAIFVTNAGETTSGMMPNNGAVALTMNPLSSENVTVPEGYHNGSGKVSLSSELVTKINTVNGGTAASTVATGMTNTEAAVSSQADLISQIQTALEGKAGGSEAQTATVTFSANGSFTTESLHYIGSSGYVQTSDIVPGDTITCVAPSILYIKVGYLHNPPSVINGDATSLDYCVQSSSTNFGLYLIEGDAEVYLNSDSSCCFVPGTQVLYSLDGETKVIEEFTQGDSVVSYNITTGENYIAKVDKLIVHENTTDIAEVTLENGATITMNAYHPIYCETGFKSITCHNSYDELVVGDNVKVLNGWSKIVEINRYESEPIVTYNLAISDIEENPDDDTNDTFYANGVVVHNATPECT